MTTKKRVDPQPMRQTLADLGYERVHTFYDSHGNGHQETYQRRGPTQRNVVLYVDQDGGLTEFGTEAGLNFRDYLLARDILERRDPDTERWVPVAERRVSPCGTAEFRDYKDTLYDRYVRVTSVGGHGDWARPIKPDEAGQEWEYS